MASENETIADIVAAMRGPNSKTIRRMSQRLRNGEWRDDFRTAFKDYADRIEAAWKREAAEIEVNAAPLPAVMLTHGNAAAMREALELLNQLFNSCVLGTHSEMTAAEMDKVDDLYFKTKAALAAPPRNCDVGTASEQHVRFTNYCNAHGDCVDCPIKAEWHKALSCGIIWSQTPYAEKGADA